MSNQNAFVHPCYNPDILSLIFRACEPVGPRTMLSLALTHKVAMRMLLANALWPKLVSSYRNIRMGVKPNAVGQMSYESWQAYAIRNEDLKGVPKWALDADMFDLMIPRNGLVIRFMYGLRMEIQTCERFMLACGQNGLALQHVPSWAHSRELYMTACMQNGAALEFIQKKKQWDELCMLACLHGAPLCYVRKQTAEIVNTAVRCNPWNIQHANPKFLSMELCINAMRRTFGGVLQSIPQDMLRNSDEMCDLAPLSQAFVLLPVDLMTQERIITAVLNARMDNRELFLIQRLRNSNVTILESTWQAMVIDGLGLKHVPEEYRSLEVCLAGVHDLIDLNYVPHMFNDYVRKIHGMY
jgi:hypothetical protein